MKRRQFLRMAAILTAAGGIGQLVRATPAFASQDMTVLADRLLTVHADPKSAAVVGKALLKDMPARPALDHVVQRLMRSLDLPTRKMATLSPGDLRARLKKTTSEDFQRGRTAQVQGWVLGETEAWLCGLAALRTG